MTRALTARDIASDLGLSRHTVYQRLAAGVIPGFRLGGDGPWRTDAEVYAEWRRRESAPVDPNRIEPRSSRSRSALGRRAS